MGLFYFFLFFLENYLLGAFFLTLPAVGAFGRIDVSDIILHGNRIEFTYFLTHFASYTTDGTCHGKRIKGKYGDSGAIRYLKCGNCPSGRQE